MPAKKPAKKNEGSATVKVSDKIGNGKGGYFKKGDKFTPCDAGAAKELKERGLID